MITLSLPNQYFSPKATLECGQVFRFTPFEGGYLLISADKACLLREENKTVFLTCEEAGTKRIFAIISTCRRIMKKSAPKRKPSAYPFFSAAAPLRQRASHSSTGQSRMISFLVSQQNNIPRIKGILSRIAAALGEKKSFLGQTYHAFPSLRALAEGARNFIGKRVWAIAPNMWRTLRGGFFKGLSPLENKRGSELKKALTSYMGVGNKVADGISPFAFHETAAFPVDTWIEKLYHQDFGGTETDREKFELLFVEKFGRNGRNFSAISFLLTKRENTRASV